jgi:hypothetical protein
LILLTFIKAVEDVLSTNFVFLNMGKIKSAKTDYAIPGEAMNQHKFEEMIRKAEKGPFHMIADIKTAFAKWKAKYPM